MIILLKPGKRENLLIYTRLILQVLLESCGICQPRHFKI